MIDRKIGLRGTGFIHDGLQPVTLVDGHGLPVDLTPAKRIVRYVDNDPPEDVQAVDAKQGLVPFPATLSIGDHRIAFKIYWEDDIIQVVPPVDMNVLS